MTRALLLALALAACGDDARFAEGRAALDGGDPAAAATSWSGLVEAGEPSTDLWLAVGHARYAEGDVPRAIAAWRRAWTLSPRDSDVIHDLAVARSRLDGVPAPVGPSPAWTVVGTPVELGGLAGLLLVAFSAGAVRARRREASPWPPAAVGALGLLLAAVAVAGALEQSYRPIRVIVEGPARVRVDAALDAPSRFALPAGTEVKRVDRTADFALIEDGDGRRGWVPVSALDPG